MKNPLQPIMDWYRIAIDSMRVTTRVLELDIRKAITSRHVFRMEPTASSLDLIEQAESELDDLVVLGLVATFERTLRDYLMERPGVMLEGSDPVNAAIHGEILKDIEYWRLADRLILIFKDRIEANQFGLIKQIVGYRNWVAHGRATPNPPDGNIEPKMAFERLTNFLRSAGIIDHT